MAKLMSTYVVFRALKEARSSTIPWSQQQRQTSHLGKQSLSNSPIVAGVDHKVSELIKMLFVPLSAAVIMLANAVATMIR